MPGILTLKSDVSLDVLRAHWRFALARLKSDPNAAAYVADFTAFGPTWVAVDQQELAYEDAVAAADAAVVAADEAIDALVDKVTVAISGGKKVVAGSPLLALYFGSLTPSVFKRPILGTELQNVQSWPALLAKATQPALQALGAPITAAVAAGNAAAKAFNDALAARGSFRVGGDRQKAFDAFNSLCAKAYGGLKAFSHDHPDLALPSTYAESFFKGSAGATHGKTVAETAAAAASAQAKAAKAQAKHDAALKAAAAREAALKDKQAKADAAKAAAQAAKTAAAAARAAKAAAKKKLPKA
jgi:hypothetical protein